MITKGAAMIAPKTIAAARIAQSARVRRVARLRSLNE